MFTPLSMHHHSHPARQSVEPCLQRSLYRMLISIVRLFLAVMFGNYMLICLGDGIGRWWTSDTGARWHPATRASIGEATISFGDASYVYHYRLAT
jgi:hypothetical protein